MSTTRYCNHPRWIWMAQGNIPEGLQLIWLSPEREVLHYFSHKQTWSPLRCLTATIEGRIDEPSEDPIILYSCVESFSRGFARVLYDFQLTTVLSKVKRNNLKLHCWKETAAEQIKILNKTTTPQHLVSPEYLKGSKRGFQQINIYSYTIIVIIHTYDPTDQYVNILYIHDISPLFLFMANLPGSFINIMTSSLLKLKTGLCFFFVFVGLEVHGASLLQHLRFGCCAKDRRPTEGLKRSPHFQYAPWIRKGKNWEAPGHGSPKNETLLAPKR